MRHLLHIDFYDVAEDRTVHVHANSLFSPTAAQEDQGPLSQHGVC